MHAIKDVVAVGFTTFNASFPLPLWMNALGEVAVIFRLSDVITTTHLAEWSEGRCMGAAVRCTLGRAGVSN